MLKTAPVAGAVMDWPAKKAVEPTAPPGPKWTASAGHCPCIIRELRANKRSKPQRISYCFWIFSSTCSTSVAPWRK